MAITDAELVERAVRYAKPLKDGPQWAAVARVLGCGGSEAYALCRRFSLNPDDPLLAYPR